MGVPQSQHLRCDGLHLLRLLWLSFAAYVWFIVDDLGAGAATATGLYLLAWGIFTAYMTVAALRVNVAVLLVFVFLTLMFFVLAAAEFSAATTGCVGG